MIPLSYYLVLSGILFVCGVLGFLIKRNIITIFMSIELMLNGVNLSFVAFAAQWHALSGQVFVFLRDGSGCGRGRGGPGDHHRRLSHA
jgi:NADH-quinone oxidoreductase subunit K